MCGKLVSLLESLIIFAKRFKVSSVPSFIPDFYLLSCELEILHLKCYTEYKCYTDTILKQNKFTVLTHFLVKNLKCFFFFFFASSVTKNV